MLAIWINGTPPPGDGTVSWLIMVAVAALAAAPIGTKLFARLGAFADALAKRPAVAILCVAIFAFAASATLSILINFPEPIEHDEFSYLLAGQTYARGRLTNPKHPLWEFFETIHVIHDPTYQSKYPPAQGLALALGIAIAGEPVVGVWLAAALACGALAWMLLAWVPGRWAVAGGFVAALHPVMLEWSASYWGGAIALAGGALVLGAMRRLWVGPKLSDGLILGVGALILANSRPFEGLLLCAAVGIGLLLRFARPAAPGKITVFIGPLIVLLPGLLWMLYYNHRVTGHALLTPYMRHDQIYTRTPHFYFQQMKPPRTYNNPQLARQHNQWEPQYWQRQQTFTGWAREAGRKTYTFLRGFFQPLWLLVPLLMLPPLLRRDRWMMLAGILLVFFIIGLWSVTWNPLLHYAAPAAPLALVLLVASMAAMASAPRGWPIILRISLALFFFSAWPTVAFIRHAQQDGPHIVRVKLQNTILAEYPNDKHLFIIRYLPGHNERAEWVYNGPDIDKQKIVWARDLGDNQALIDYYKNRRQWIIEVGPESVTPRPFGWVLK